MHVARTSREASSCSFHGAYSLEEAMKPPAVRGNLRRCKLCLEHVGPLDLFFSVA